LKENIMVEEAKDRVVNTGRKVEEQDYKREPNERDESPDGDSIKPRGIIAQAAEDLQNGLVDTENYLTRADKSLENATEKKPDASGQANPLPERHRDMRDHDSVVPVDGGKNR
jgi:hypothetical protein